MSGFIPKPLIFNKLPPKGFDFAVEVHMPEKEIQVKGFPTYKEAYEYLGQIRQLQTKGVRLYTRILRRVNDFSMVPGTGKIKAVPEVKGKLYCPICHDYTVFPMGLGPDDSDYPRCQYCTISTSDWYVKSLNGLWPKIERGKIING